MRFLFTDEEIEVIQGEAWSAGFGAGAAIGVGLTLVGCGAWAMLAGVWS